MLKEFVSVWQREYAGVREVCQESDSSYDELVRGSEFTVRNHGGVIRLYEIANDGRLILVNKIGEWSLETVNRIESALDSRERRMQD